MPKVNILDSFGVLIGQKRFHKGNVIDVSDDVAKVLVGNKQAELVKGQTPEKPSGPDSAPNDPNQSDQKNIRK